MKKLIIWGIPQGNFYGKYLLEARTNFIELTNNEYYFASFVNLKTISLKIKTSKFKEIVDFSSYMKMNWKEGNEYLQKIQDKYNFDAIIFIFAPVNSNMTTGNEKRLINNWKQTSINNTYRKNFSSTFTAFKRLFTCFYYGKSLPIIHFLDDLLEVNMSELIPNAKDYHMYSISDRNIQFSPIVIDYDIWMKQSGPKEKIYDFSFGFSNVNKIPSRTKIYQDLKEFPNIFYKGDDINTFIERDVYNDHYITSSKYTLIIPAYDNTQFSMIRFCEALKRECIPLIHETCKFEHSFNERKEFLEVIKKHNLIVDTTNFNKKIKSFNYNKIIDDFKSTKDWKYYNSIDTYKNHPSLSDF